MDIGINWNWIAQAINYYHHTGYTSLEAPWAVSPESMRATAMPATAAPPQTPFGELVGSGEQSFVEIMDTIKPLGRAVCCTPCFRNEVAYDELHLPYFMKVELIDTNVSISALKKMIHTAAFFYKKGIGIACKVIETGINTFDLVDTTNEIELGSYGIRDYKEHSWIYGTGLAEPRGYTARSKQCP